MTADIVDFKSRKKIAGGESSSKPEGERTDAIAGIEEALKHFRESGIPYNRALITLVSDDCEPGQTGFTGASVNMGSVLGLGYLRLTEEVLLANIAEGMGTSP